MHALTYFLAYPFLYIISRLPFYLFYLLSDLLSFFMQYILRYRKDIIRKNLNLVFPKLSKKEKIIIEKKVYKHICDLFLEVIKSLGMSKREMTKRFKFKNIEIIKSAGLVFTSLYLGRHFSSLDKTPIHHPAGMIVNCLSAFLRS